MLVANRKYQSLGPLNAELSIRYFFSSWVSAKCSSHMESILHFHTFIPCPPRQGVLFSPVTQSTHQSFNESSVKFPKDLLDMKPSLWTQNFCRKEGHMPQSTRIRRPLFLHSIFRCREKYVFTCAGQVLALQLIHSESKVSVSHGSQGTSSLPNYSCSLA